MLRFLGSFCMLISDEISFYSGWNGSVRSLQPHYSINMDFGLNSLTVKLYHCKLTGDKSYFLFGCYLLLVACNTIDPVITEHHCSSNMDFGLILLSKYTCKSGILLQICLVLLCLRFCFKYFRVFNCLLHIFSLIILWMNCDRWQCCSHIFCFALYVLLWCYNNFSV